MDILAAIDIILIFDIILLVYGGYTIYSAVVMKKTQTPSKWLVPEQELKKCRDAKGFAEAMYIKTIVFGAVLALFGLVSFLNRMFWLIAAVEYAGIVVFLGACAVYVVMLNRTRRQYF